MDRAMKSVRKLTGNDVETVIGYHGGVYSDNVKERLLKLAEGEKNESK